MKISDIVLHSEHDLVESIQFLVGSTIEYACYMDNKIFG